MALHKRGKKGTWHYDFWYKKKRYQGSTGQTNINKARLAESTIRSNAALEALGVAAPKLAPVFSEFIEGRFKDFVHRHAKAKRTAKFYDEKGKRLVDSSLKDLRLSEIDEAAIERYCDSRAKVSPSTLNGELATLRKALNLAMEWKLILSMPRVRRLPGEKPREFVVSAPLEAEYLAAATYPLKHAAILILDLGLRPEECVRLTKDSISGGMLMVRDGKSKNATRSLPLTERALASIGLSSALWPDSEFLFPGRKGTHLTRGALDNLHTKLRKARCWPKEFVLYSFRHTFGTRLAESGASVFDITKLMGHSSIVISQRYIHISGEHLGIAMKRKELLDKISRGEAVPSDSTTPVSK